MSDGVIYCLSGDKHAAMLVTGLHALRRWWSGPVLLFSGDDRSDAVCDKIAAEGRLDVTVDKHSFRPEGGSKGKHHAAKTLLPELSPFDRTVFLDADTLVVGDFMDLFPSDGSAEVRLTRFANWVTNGGMISGRLRGWVEPMDDSEQVKQWCKDVTSGPLPAINTGTFGFSVRSHEYLAEWKRATYLNPVFLCDELAANLIVFYYPHMVLDERWNASPIYTDREDKHLNCRTAQEWIDELDVRILHTHGFKNCNNPVGKLVWVPAYEQAVKENTAGIADWSPGRDKRLSRFIEEQKI